jgi:hypothetical protein
VRQNLTVEEGISMVKRFIRLIAAFGIGATASLTAAPAVFADGITTDGPNSDVKVSSSNTTTVTSNNNVSVTNTTTQTAKSGDATVSNNTTGGNATSGNTSNSNSTAVDLSISNLGSTPARGGGSGSVSTEGPNSPVSIHEHNTTTVTNNNNAHVSNSTTQSASTGNAKVSNNTTGGNATSGNASNSNSTCVSVSINNGGGGTSANNSCVASQPGGGSGGGNQGQPAGGAGGQVLGALTVATLAGGKGAGAFAQLPNTGLKDGVSAWLVVSIVTILASAAYWRVAITPKLKTS